MDIKQIGQILLKHSEEISDCILRIAYEHENYPYLSHHKVELQGIAKIIEILEKEKEDKK